MTSVTQARHRKIIGGILPILALLLTALCTPALAFDNLSEAQTLVYDTPHLSNTQSGQKINYSYTSKISSGTEVEDLSDNVVLSVLNSQEDDKRDVSIEFLSGAQRLPLPDFKAYRGNPVIIAMLEYVAVTMGRDTGGGALYFRNRIKDGLANEDIEITSVSANYSDKTVKANQFSFSPFVNDSYLVERPAYTGSVFTFTLSDEVPGGVLELSVSSTQAMEDGFQHNLTLD